MVKSNMDNMEQQFNDARIEHVSISELIMDAGTQQRAKMNDDAIENYASAMAEYGTTEQFPPLRVVRLSESVTLNDDSVVEAGAFILVDGFHRTEAALSSGFDDFQAIVADGTYQDAVYYSMRANQANGLHLNSRDYRNAIQRLYLMDPYWREHGRKKEIAKLFGCSTKTVQRAVVSIDKDIKAKAFKMFEMGAVDSYVAEFAHKDLSTIQRWRADYEQSKLEPEVSRDEAEEKPDNVLSDDPMDLTFRQILTHKDFELRTNLLKLLTESVETERQQLAYQAEQETVVDDSIVELAESWEGKSCWEVLGKSYDEVLEAKNPRGMLKRMYSLQLRKCHTDTYGDNPALELLKSAYAEAEHYFKN